MNDINIHNSKVGVIGDDATIYGGINFYEFARPQPVDATTLSAACERLDALPTDNYLHHALTADTVLLIF